MESITVNRTDIVAQEWHDAVFIRYSINPLGISHHCHGCEMRFYVTHTFDYKKGVIITARHNDIRDGIPGLACKALTPTHMRYIPLITPGWYISIGRAIQAKSEMPNKQLGTTVYYEQKGDLLTRVVPAPDGTIYLVDINGTR